MRRTVPAKGVVRRRYFYVMRRHSIEEFLHNRCPIAVAMKQIDEPAFTRMITQGCQKALPLKRTAEKKRDGGVPLSGRLDNPQSFRFV